MLGLKETAATVLTSSGAFGAVAGTVGGAAMAYAPSALAAGTGLVGAFALATGAALGVGRTMIANYEAREARATAPAAKLG